MQLKSFDEVLDEDLKDPEKRKWYEKAQQQDNAAIEIYDRRNDIGLSRRELAKKSGISKKVITKIEQGDMDFTDESMEIMEQVLRSLRKEDNPSVAYQK